MASVLTWTFVYVDDVESLLIVGAPGAEVTATASDAVPQFSDAVMIRSLLSVDNPVPLIVKAKLVDINSLT